MDAKPKVSINKVVLAAIIGGAVFALLSLGYDYKKESINEIEIYLAKAVFMGLVFGSLNWYEQYRALKKAD